MMSSFYILFNYLLHDFVQRFAVDGAEYDF